MKQIEITRQHGRSHIQLTATRPYPSSWQQTVIHAIHIFDFLLPGTTLPLTPNSHSIQVQAMVQALRAEGGQSWVP